MATIKFPCVVDNVIKCIYCGKYIQYDELSIYQDSYFDTDEYTEGHFFDYIECPNCHKHLPLKIK